jgi:hypothetical protein
MLEHEEKYAVTLAFDVKVRSSVADPGCSSRIQIFSVTGLHQRI